MTELVIFTGDKDFLNLEEDYLNYFIKCNEIYFILEDEMI